MHLRRRLLGGIGIVAAAFGVSVAAQSTRTQEPEVLSALLVEVRGLRAAMEQMAAAGPRVQLALGRLQLQEQRVNTMIRRLETLRDSISDAEKSAATQQAQLATMENFFKTNAGPPDERNPMAAMIEGLRKAAATSGEEIQRLQAEEAQLQQQIAAEQGRWSEINRTVEDLERALSKR